ncbi:ovostatin-like isoform X2 [Xenopus tropicalis]|uniref:Ovostatin-like isoform X2 n=1 Tax=Xenopus tropicalis TaxID=8364 RepID=A0A8J1JTP1_XENTR|nr:ovostatin-like isoform X2 [Xenopus tropicalis]
MQKVPEMGTMFLRRFLCWVSILGLIGGVAAKPQYAFSVPFVLTPGENTIACMNFLDLDEPLHLHVYLAINGTNHTVFTDEIPARDTFRCKEFQVPDVESNEYSEPPVITMVATGQELVIVKHRSVAFNRNNNIYLVQLDTPIHRPGHKVQFRVISLDSQFRPVNEEGLESDTRLAEWHNLTAEHGVVPLDFTLPNDAPLGSYSILVRNSEHFVAVHEFKVKEYELPRFQLTVDVPKEIFLKNNMSVSVSAGGPNGQGVPGRLSGSLCTKFGLVHPGDNDVCINITGETDSSGTFSKVLNLNELPLDLIGHYVDQKLNITVKEEAAETLPQSPKVTFDPEVLPSLKPGIPYVVGMTLWDRELKPMKNEVIELEINYENVQNLTTDAEGKAQYEIDMATYDSSYLFISANYKGPGEESRPERLDDPLDYIIADRFYSLTGSYIQVDYPQKELSCGKTYDIPVRYLLSPEGLGGGVRNISFYFLMVSRGKIVSSGEHSVDVSDKLPCLRATEQDKNVTFGEVLVDVNMTRCGNFSLSLTMPSQYSPRINIVVYSMLQAEVITGIAHLNMEKCLKHQVSLSFSASEGAPGSDVYLMLKADPGSLCGLQIIDSSILLHNNKGQITAEELEYALYNQEIGFMQNHLVPEEPETPCIEGNGSDSVLFYREGSAYFDFQNAGLIFATNTSLQRPWICGDLRRSRGYFFRQRMMLHNTKYKKHHYNTFEEQFPKVTKLKYAFPEIWSFDVVMVGESGSASVTLRVPDTSSQWQASMFCLSEESGLGMTNYPSNFTSTL